MKRYLVDTNVLLRFLTGEPETQAEQAKRLVQQSENGALSLRIVPLVVAEVVFVLTGRHYQLEREAVVRVLTEFLEAPGFEVDNRDTLLAALQIFRQQKVDYVDAYLVAEAMGTSTGIASFDRDFKRFPELPLCKL